MLHTRSFNQVATTPLPPYRPRINDAFLKKAKPTDPSLTSWVAGKIAKAKKVLDSQPASLMEFPVQQPLGCICDGIGKYSARREGNDRVIRQRPTFEWKVELPVEFDEVLRRRISERIQLYAQTPFYESPSKPRCDECVLMKGSSEYFGNIDSTPGSKKCCGKTGHYYLCIVLISLVMETVREVLPRFDTHCGADFLWLSSACCPARYVAETKICINETLRLNYCECTSHEKLFERCVVSKVPKDSAR